MRTILTAVIAMLVSIGTAQTVVSNNVLTKRICYVKKDAKGSNTGESWQDALTELSTALDFAKAHQKEFTKEKPLEIWVAGSEYSPKVGDGITADKATFAMVKNVKIYGGFAGNETALQQRNWYENPTVLSGRVNNAGVAHIGRLITSEGAMGVATLDGFRLKHAAPRNGKKGVAIYVANGSPRFENCAITDNLFGSEALIYVIGERERAKPIFINLQVSNNTPDNTGDNVDDNIDKWNLNQPNNGADGLVPWAMENDQYADTQLINATFYKNGGNDLKIAPSASPKIYNTVLLERVEGNIKNIDVQHSMVNGAPSGKGNIPVESPADIFVSLSQDDKYYLRPKGKLINLGEDGLYSLYHNKSYNDNDFDLAHMPRIMNGKIDIGAYEFYKDYESICNEMPTPYVETISYGDDCSGRRVEVKLLNYTDYRKNNQKEATYKVYDHQGKEVRPYMEPLIESSGIIHINQAGHFRLVVSYNGCEKESNWFQIYYSRGAGRPGIPSLKDHPATCDSNSWEEIQNYESKYRYELIKGNSKPQGITDRKLVGLEEGSYELRVYNKNSYECYSSKEFTIKGREKLEAPIVEPLPAECGKKGKGYITQFNPKLEYHLFMNGKVLRTLDSAEFTADAGTYQVVVRNTNGCVATSTTFDIGEAKEIPQKPDVHVDEPACGVSGKAIITNYDHNLTYKLYNGTVTEKLTSAEINKAGKYTLLVSKGSCDSEEVQFVVEPAKEGVVAPKVTTTSATCGEIGKAYIEDYDSNLRYRLVALSATGAVVKSSPINTANLSVAAGTYQVVVVRKANGCVATSATFVIEEAKKIPEKPVLSFKKPACGVSGKAIIEGYDRNLTYRLYNGTATETLTSAEINKAGEYTLWTENNDKCSSEKVHFTVAAAKENATAPIVRTTSATCGEIGKAYIDNYNEKLTYQLVALSATGAAVKSTPINTKNLSVAAGSYKVEVSNADGCVATSATFVIEEAKKIPEKPVLSFEKPACGVSGKAIIKNYDRNLTYNLNNGASTKNLTSAEISEAGKYTLEVSNGTCSREVQFVVEPAKEGAVAPVVRTTSATCGEIGKARITNYDSNLRYRLVALSATGAAVESSEINGAAIAVAAGSYKVEVRNADGCVATSTTFVIEEAKKIPALPKIDFITRAACGVANDIRIGNYDKNFSYTLISKSGVRKPLHSLHIEATEGTYQLEVSNGDCAVTTGEFYIDEEKIVPAKPELRVLSANCGGVTNVLIKNYDKTLNYELSPAIAGNEILSNGVISATANNYVLIVNNGSCTAQSDPFEIKAQLLPPAVPTIEEVEATCAAPSLVRISNYDPALQYILSPAGEILQGGVISATVGRYIVIATNSNGCRANSSIFDINPQREAPAQPKITVYKASCGTKGSAVIRNYRGEYTYSFTPEATIIAGGVISATAGKYQLKVSNGTCETTAVSFEIEAEQAIPAQPTVIVTAPDCGVAGSARIGNYDPQLSYTVLPKREGNVVLANGVISVTAGSYNVVVSNGYCKKSSELFIVQRANEIPATPIVVTTSATCGQIGKARIANYDRRYTDKYVLTPSGRVHYDGTIIAGAGNYVLSVNNGSCKVSTAFTIEAEKAMPQAPAIVTTPATCGEAGSAKITNYDSNFTYTLLEGNNSTVLDDAVISVGEGVYRVSVTNAAGCQVISREFSIQAAKVISEKPVVITQAATCGEEGSAYVYNYNPIYQYTVFPNGSVDANGNIKASKNIFTYVTAHYKGCSATSEGFTIQPKLNGVEQPEILLIPGGCGSVGYARITNFNPDYEYEVLPTGTGTITSDGRVMAPPTNTYYRVRAFHNGCAATSENFRLQPSSSGFEKPVLSVAKEDCNMGTIAFVKNYNKEFTYTVHPFGGVTKDTGILVFPQNSVTHTFSVTVTASNGVCQSTSDALLIMPERSYQPRVAIVARTCDSEGAAYITNYNPAYRYVFTDPLLSVTDAGVILGAQPELVYAVAARTPDDCSSKETVFSIRNECENEVPCRIEIFNAVSANNDDANDFFYIKNIECYPSNKVYIFNDQGKVVFEQQNYDNSQRSFRGIGNTEGAQLLPSGTYFYILKYADKRGRETDERGYLYLKGRY